MLAFVALQIVAGGAAAAAVVLGQKHRQQQQSVAEPFVAVAENSVVAVVHTSPVVQQPAGMEPVCVAVALEQKVEQLLGAADAALEQKLAQLVVVVVAVVLESKVELVVVAPGSLPSLEQTQAADSVVVVAVVAAAGQARKGSGRTVVVTFFKSERYV